jgi:hypothetical protein
MRYILISFYLFVTVFSHAQNLPIPSTSGDWHISIANQYYKHSVNPQMAVSGCIYKPFSRSGYTRPFVMAVTNNMQGNLHGGSTNSIVSVFADIEKPFVFSNRGMRLNVELSSDFVPEDVSIINYDQGSYIYAIVVGKLLNPNGYSVAYQVFELRFALPAMHLTAINVSPTIIEDVSVPYNLDSDDLVRIDDDGNSKFTIVYSRQGQIRATTGYLDPASLNGAELNLPETVFPNSNTGPGEYIRPDVAMLEYSIEPNPGDPEVSFSGVLNADPFSGAARIFVYNTSVSNFLNGNTFDFSYDLPLTTPHIALRQSGDWGICWRSYKNYLFYLTANSPVQCYAELTVYGDGKTTGGQILPIPGPDIIAVDGEFLVTQTQYNYSRSHMDPISANEDGFRVVCERIDAHCPVESYEVSRHGAGFEDYQWSWGSSATGFKNARAVIPQDVTFLGEVGFGFHQPYLRNTYATWFGNTPHVKHSNVNGRFVVSKAKKPIDDELINEDLFIYPSPAYNQIHISNGYIKKGDIVSIYDVNGRLLLNKRLTEKTIDINFLPPGTYLLTVSGEFKKKFSRLFVKASK